MSSDEVSDDERRPIRVALKHARIEAALRDFVRTKCAEGLISESHAKEIVAAADDLYRQEGLLTDETSEQPTLRSVSEIQAMAAVVRHGCHLLERKIVDLYPGLAKDVNELLASGRGK